MAFSHLFLVNVNQLSLTFTSMQDQRQRFRFRLPWPAGPQTQAPAQKPPFRPPGRAPPAPKPRGRTATPSPAVTSASPSRRNNETQVRVSSPSPAPKVQSTSQVAPKPQSLSGLAPHSTSSQPNVSSNKSQPNVSSTKSQPNVSSTKSQPASQPSNPPPSLAQQEQSKPEAFQPLPQPRPESAVAEAAPRKPVTSRKLDDGHISVDQSQFTSPAEEEKTEDQAYEQPIRKTITQLLTTASGSRTQTKELRTVAFQAEQKQGTLDRSNTKQVHTAGSRLPKVRHADTESHQDSDGERPPLHKQVRNDISKFVHNLAPAHTNEKPVSIVTLAGDNRGASMQLGSDSTKKQGSVHIHRGYKAQPDEIPESTTDAEESFKGRSKDHMTKEDQAIKAYVNNNVQSLNNSIVFDSCVTERNPGVQLALSQSKAQPDKPIPPAEPPQTNKVQFRVTPAQKLTYQPTVRRRCLRGLFMESSDSEPDNPDKPRRHGCRYSCGLNSKDKDIGIL